VTYSEPTPTDSLALGVTYYSYTDEGRLQKEARQSSLEGCARVTAYTYNGNGRITRIQYPTNRIVDYFYPGSPNDEDRVASVTTTFNGINPTSLVSNVKYHALGGIRELTYGNGLVAQFPRHYDGRFLQSKHYSGADFWQDLKVATNLLDGVGNFLGLSDLTNTRLSQTFTYDNLYRLDYASVSDSAAGAAYASQDYAYNGSTENRASIVRDGGPLQSYGYFTGTNRLQSAEGVSYTYAADGNATAIGGATLTYDDERRLRKYRIYSGGSWRNWQYFYDHNGRRVRKRDCSGTSEFCLNHTEYHYEPGGRVQSELGPFSSIGTYPYNLREHVYISGRRIAVIDSQRTSQSGVTDKALYFSHGGITDAPAQLTDGSKVTVWKANYDPFGAVKPVLPVSQGGGERRTISVSTPHNYPNGDCTGFPSGYQYACTVVWTSPAGSLKWPGASRIRVKFSGFNTQQNYDQARIYDKNGQQIHIYHGNKGTFWSEWIESDEMQVKLWANGSSTYYGFDLVELEAEFTPRHTFSTPSVPAMTHPYANSPGCCTAACYLTYDSGVIQVANATRLRAKLDKFETEFYWDRAKVYDGSGNEIYSYDGLLGTQGGSLWTGWITGDKIQIKLWVDCWSYAAYYGFDVTQVEADMGTTLSMFEGEAFQLRDSESGLAYNTARYYDPVTGRYISPDPKLSCQVATPYAYATSNPSEGLTQVGSRHCRKEMCMGMWTRSPQHRTRTLRGLTPKEERRPRRAGSRFRTTFQL
jgi:RHS repeat-associated protein